MPKEYIEREAAIKELNDSIKDKCDTYGLGVMAGINFAVQKVINAPATDVMEVVRCRECIAYTPVDDNTGKCVFLIGKHQYVVPDGYCYLGERKEGADNG